MLTSSLLDLYACLTIILKVETLPKLAAHHFSRGLGHPLKIIEMNCRYLKLIKCDCNEIKHNDLTIRIFHPIEENIKMIGGPAANPFLQSGPRRGPRIFI